MSEGEQKKAIASVRFLARTILTDRRRHSSLIFLIILAGAVLGGGFLAWRLWPRRPLPALLLTAYDQLALPTKPTRLAAQLEPLDSAEPSDSLSDCELFFQRGQEQPTRVQADRAGFGFAPASFPAAGPQQEFLVRFHDPLGRQRGQETHGRAFVWPEESSILVVDVDAGLTATATEELWQRNSLNIQPVPGVAQALRDVRRTHRIVYLSESANGPGRYAKLRAWLERSAPAQDQLPTGPLLAVATENVEHDAAFAPSKAAWIKQNFKGKLAAVSARPSFAQVFLEAGYTAIVVGGKTEAVPGMRRSKSWAELAEHLKP